MTSAPRAEDRTATNGRSTAAELTELLASRGGRAYYTGDGETGFIFSVNPPAAEAFEVNSAPKQDPRVEQLARLTEASLTGLDICDLPQPAPLVEGLLDLDTLAVIYGPSGCGKSFIALDLACVVATGGVWQGVPVEPRSILYVVAEGAHGMGDRLQAWRSQFHTPPDMGNLHWLPIPVDLSDAGWAEALVQHATALGVQFIVIDTLARSMPGSDENSSRDMGTVIDAADALKTRTGACILFVHHTGWTEGHARGSSALRAAMDTELEVKGTAGSIRLKATKQRHHEDGQQWSLGLEPREGSCVVVHAAEVADRLGNSAHDLLATLAEADDGTGLSATAWRQASGMEGERNFYKLRARLVTRELVVNTGSDRKPIYRVSDAGRAMLAYTTKKGEQVNSS